MQMTRTELRAATDLAAKAGANTLSRTQDIAQATFIAKEIALENTVGGKNLALDDADFEFGRSTRSGNGKYLFTAGGATPNSVRITGRRTSTSADGPVPLYFGAFWGRDEFEPVVSSTATFVDVDVCLVLDRSSSMKLDVTETAGGMSGSDPRTCQVPGPSSRWIALETAVSAFLDTVGQSSASVNVAIVTFSSDNYEPCGEENIEATIDQSLTSDVNAASAAMATRANTIWNGMTNIDAGIRLGTQVLSDSSQGRPYADKVMIVFTDGVYTGDDPVPDARVAGDEGISVMTVTFSDGANQDDMTDVADAANGSHYHAPDSAALTAIFEDLAVFVSVLTQ